MGWPLPQPLILGLTVVPMFPFYLRRNSPNCASGASFRGIQITDIQTRLPLDEESPRCTRRYLYNTQQTQKTNTHAHSGIRTREPRRPQTARPSRPAWFGRNQQANAEMLLPLGYTQLSDFTGISNGDITRHTQSYLSCRAIYRGG